MKRIKKRISPRVYSEALKQKVLRTILEEGIGPSEAAHRFGIKNESSVRNWINKYNANSLILDKRETSLSVEKGLKKQELILKIKELEQKLSLERMRSDSFEMMLKLAESELNISIRKKSFTKQLKQ